MYILKILDKKHFMGNDRCVIVDTIETGNQPFSFTKNAREKTDCGFILTNMLVLKDIFNEKELLDVLRLCERSQNESINIYRHCAVSNDPNLRNNIPTSTNGVDINCII